MRKPRRTIGAALKAKIALEALREQATVTFDAKVEVEAEERAAKEKAELYAKIGQQAYSTALPLETLPL